jgi:hypothetical protein
MIKKIILLFFLLSQLSFGLSNDFVDIHSKQWFYNDISYAHKNGWVQGFQDQTFRPEANMTRLEALHITLKMMGHYPTEEDLWDEWTIINAETFGLSIVGEFYDYDENISRQEMIRIALRAIEETLEDDFYRYSQTISDFNDIDFYWQPIILRAYGLGILKGYEDQSVRAELPIKRSEGVVLLNRIYKYLNL